MADQSFLTVPELARFLGEPDWRVRRTVDLLRPVPRAGLTRLVPRDMVGEVAIALSHDSASSKKAKP